MITTFLVSALIAASTVATARMEYPSTLQTDEQPIEIKGFGGRNKGTWRLTGPSGDNYTGRFTRNESRLGVFDPLYVRNTGRSSFTFLDSAGETLISGECSFRKVALTASIVSIDTDKLAYECDLYGNGDEIHTFTLGEPRRKGMQQKLLAQDLRSGEARLFNETLTIESVHSYKGTRLTSQAPVGYVLMQGDKAVGALELTDTNPGIYLANDLTPTLERAVYVASLALSVLRDPANSALED